MDDLVSLVAELKEEVERLRAVRECEDRLVEQIPARPERKAAG